MKLNLFRNKGGEVRRSRFSTPMHMRHTHSETARRLVGEMEQLSSHTNSNRLHLPTKINDASAPRKLRSAMKRREPNCTSTLAPLPTPTNGSITKKHKPPPAEQDAMITKDEEEVAEALFALAHTTTPSPLVLQPPNEAQPSPSPNRCWLHVYICHFIKGIHPKHQLSSSYKAQGVLLATNTPKTTSTCTHLQDPTPTFHALALSQQQQVVHHMDMDTNKQHSAIPNYTQHQRQCLKMDKGKMQQSTHHHKGALFLVDSGPILTLTL